MPLVLGAEAVPFNYADDTGLLYVITESNRDTIIDTVNNDLQALVDNHTTFEKTKTHMMVVSNKNASAFDPTGIVMGGHKVEQLEELKLMGYIFDEALSWGPQRPGQGASAT